MSKQHAMDEMKKCSTCGMDTEGHKCELCGEESAEHDPGHSCGGEHCMPKCKGCGQAQSKCTCQPQRPSQGM